MTATIPVTVQKLLGYSERFLNKQTEKQVDGQTDRQTERWIDIEIDR